MRVHLGGEKLIDQFRRQTFGQVRLGPVDAVIPVPRSGVRPRILLKDHARNILLGRQSVRLCRYITRAHD